MGTDSPGAPTVVLIHPVGLDLTYWGAQIEAMQPTCDVIAFDLLGHGAMLLALARVGAGIVQLTELQIEQDLRSGTLIELFRNRRTHDTDPIYAVYRSKRHLSPRIRVFLDFLDSSFSRKMPPD